VKSVPQTTPQVLPSPTARHLQLNSITHAAVLPLKQLSQALPLHLRPAPMSAHVLVQHLEVAALGTESCA